MVVGKSAGGIVEKIVGKGSCGVMTNNFVAQVPPDAPELATAVLSPPDKDLLPTIYDTMQPGPDHFEDDIARSTFAPLLGGMSPALEDLPEVHVTVATGEPREQPPTPLSVPSECPSNTPTPVITKTRTRALSNFKLDEVKVRDGVNSLSKAAKANLRLKLFPRGRPSLSHQKKISLFCVLAWMGLF